MAFVVAGLVVIAAFAHGLIGTALVALAIALWLLCR